MRNQSAWLHKIKHIKQQHSIHVWYSSEDGWAWLSYKGRRVKINAGFSIKQIDETINELKSPGMKSRA